MRTAFEFAEFVIDPAPIWPAEDLRLEPIVLAGPRWFGYGPAADEEEPEPESAQPAIEEIHPPITGSEPAEPHAPISGGNAPTVAARPPSSSSLLGSLGVHVLPLLLLLGWSVAPAEIEAAIPVRLVIEESSPAAEPVAPEPPPSTAASQSADGAEPAAVVPAPRQQTAAAVPRPPKPKPEPKPAMSRPREQAVAPPPRERAASASIAPASAAVSPLPAPPRPPVSTPGSSARASYFERLVVLTRPYFYMLPASFLAGRRGRTVLSILVREDGAVERIAVRQSSGYPDIDQRIQQMVGAIGRFPPLPEGFQRPSVELDFNLAFPDAMQQ